MYCDIVRVQKLTLVRVEKFGGEPVQHTEVPDLSFPGAVSMKNIEHVEPESWCAVM